MFFMILGLYLLCGLLFLAYAFKINRVLWKNIKEAPYDIFNKLSAKGTYAASLRTMKVGIYPAIWLGWIFVLLGMVQGKFERKKQ